MTEQGPVRKFRPAVEVAQGRVAEEGPAEPSAEEGRAAGASACEPESCVKRIQLNFECEFFFFRTLVSSYVDMMLHRSSVHGLLRGKKPLTVSPEQRSAWTFGGWTFGDSARLCAAATSTACNARATVQFMCTRPLSATQSLF